MMDNDPPSSAGSAGMIQKLVSSRREASGMLLAMAKDPAMVLPTAS
jgi:hypothetical protein